MPSKAKLKCAMLRSRLSVFNWGNTQVHIAVVQLVELSFHWIDAGGGSVAIHRKIYLRRRFIDNAQVIYDTD